MKRYIPAIVIVSLVIGILEAPAARAQNDYAAVVTVGALVGGSTGVYSAAVCYGKDNCTAKESWALLGIYTGAGIGAMAILGHLDSRKPRTSSPPDWLGDFSNVQSMVKKGDRISVRDASGMAREGIVETISDSSLRLRSGKLDRDYSASEVTQISRFRHYPSDENLMPVMIASLLAGAILIPNTNSGEWCSGKGAGTCVLGSAAVGSALYLGLSAIPKRPQTIFLKSTPRTTSGINWGIAPIVSKNTRGAAMSLSF